METIYARNVEEAYNIGVNTLWKIGDKQSSRAGDVLVADFPVMTVYERPNERVLLDAGRDANPFFHLFESLWMLSGRNDARWLDRFVSDFSQRFAEEDGTIHGAYGHRWRHSDEDGVVYDFDQLNTCVKLLKNNPRDRRVVIQMWDAMADLDTDKKDIPCNTHIYLRIVNGRLDLTVMCRSNDIIWGAYGANAVHFSVLQEYLAGRIGVQIGKLYQLSNNWHAYIDVLKKVGLPRTLGWYEKEIVHAEPMGEHWDYWDEDLRVFMDWTENPGTIPSQKFYNQWFDHIAMPLFCAHDLWKRGDRSTALDVLEQMRPCDWQVAASNWISRRVK